MALRQKGIAAVMPVHDPATHGRDPDLQPDPEVPAEEDVSRSDADPARRDLRSEIGKYVSLASFPTQAASLSAIAEDQGATDEVVRRLRELGPDREFQTARDVWVALDLETTERF